MTALIVGLILGAILGAALTVAALAAWIMRAANRIEARR